MIMLLLTQFAAGATVKRNEIPSIKGLTSFIAAAECQSFTRAAAELSLSQGAISRHVREIEGHLGIRLFERIRQRVVLTEAGGLYLSYIKTPLADLAAASRKVEAFADGSILTLAVVPALATRWLLPRLPAFHKKNPRITVNVTMRQRPVDFAIELFDAAIAFDPPICPGTSPHHIMDMEIVAACSPKLMANTPIERPADIVNFPLLHKMSQPHRWPEWMAQLGVNGDFPPRRGQAFAQMSKLAEAAMAGLGIAIVPRQLFAEEFGHRRLEVFPVRPAAMNISYYMLVPERHADSDVVQTFTHWLIGEAASDVPNVRALSA
jgi:LysR family transcriptional regulator, glycine cleavage system transcriptional activator